MNMRSSGTCKTCGLAIRWLTTPPGAWMPIDPVPVHDGNITILWNERAQRHDAIVHKRGERLPEDTLLYKSHWATCAHPPSRRREFKRMQRSVDRHPAGNVTGEPA